MVVLIPILPLIAFLLLVFFGSKLKDQAPWVSITALSISLLLSIGAAAKVFLGGEIHTVYPWFSFAAYSFQVDEISAWMLLLVSFVGLLIQIYSTGYMHGDPRYPRFFAYLSLFCAAMLGLIIANNLLLLYIFWELVGICSYFLIGFWFEKPSAAAAAKKAFIVTRTGDIGFFLGMLLIFFTVGNFDFSAIFSAAPQLAPHLLTAITLLLFCGAAGKSAQFPLHVWLPDAMEGPTPVSALIHAATMVAAGVYMVARLFPLFLLAPLTLTIIGYVGVLTAIMAGLIATTQNDIKKILAYSTISQLGLMFLALGSHSVDAGVFHLLAHGFFKALLFLGAGSIIHAVHTNEIGEMGGLARALPITFVTFMIGTLALSGIPPFSGFFSKDEVLMSAYHHLPLGFYLSLIAVFLTAFYMFRLCFKVFPGKTKGHPHESPLVMTLPLVILSVFALGFGFVQPFGAHAEEEGKLLVLGLSLSLATAGILFAWLLYGIKIIDLSRAKNTFIYKFVAGKFYLDELYQLVFGNLVAFFSQWLSLFDQKVVDGLVNFAGRATGWFCGINRWFDINLVDGLVNFSGACAEFSGEKLRRLQTGFIQNYLLFVIIGIVVIFLAR